jgi:molybdopterin converting factor small subunit
MNVKVKGIGDLRDYFGKEPQDFELPEGAILKDLLQNIEDRLGTNLPAYLWDFQRHLFRGPVVIAINNKAVQKLDTPLKNGMVVCILRALAGG